MTTSERHTVGIHIRHKGNLSSPAFPEKKEAAPSRSFQMIPLVIAVGRWCKCLTSYTVFTVLRAVLTSAYSRREEMEDRRGFQKEHVRTLAVRDSCCPQSKRGPVEAEIACDCHYPACARQVLRGLTPRKHS
jgi:hypothetical protein